MNPLATPLLDEADAAADVLEVADMLEVVDVLEVAVVVGATRAVVDTEDPLSVATEDRA